MSPGNLLSQARLLRRRTPSNPSVDHVPFGHWTLRDEAAQRRSPTR